MATRRSDRFAGIGRQHALDVYLPCPSVGGDRGARGSQIPVTSLTLSIHFDGEMIMSKEIEFDVRFVPAVTGSGVWDDPDADQFVHRFMPHDRSQGPRLGVLYMGAARPTPRMLRLVVTVGEDAKAGRYGSCFSLIISSEDEDTRSVIGDVAASRNVALFVCSSFDALEDAEPAGLITARDRETLKLVLEGGGTATALSLAEQVNIEKTAAGNRLVSLHKKGYLQRHPQPHPAGDLFVDPRSVHRPS